MTHLNGRVLCDFRKSQRLTQEMFANKVGLSVSTLQRMENNRSPLDVFEYLNFLRRLNIENEQINHVFFETVDLDAYKLFVSAVGAMRLHDYKKAIDLMESIQESQKPETYKHPVIQQNLGFYKFWHKNEMAEFKRSNQDQYEDLMSILKISNMDDYESNPISCLITPVEWNVFVELVHYHNNIKQIEKSINIVLKLLDTFLIINNEEFKSATILVLIFCFYHYGDYEQCIEWSSKLIASEQKDMMHLLYAHFHISICNKKLGKPEPDYIKPALKMYHIAKVLLGDRKLHIKDMVSDLQKETGINIEDYVKWK